VVDTHHLNGPGQTRKNTADHESLQKTPTGTQGEQGCCLGIFPNGSQFQAPGHTVEQKIDAYDGRQGQAKTYGA